LQLKIWVPSPKVYYLKSIGYNLSATISFRYLCTMEFTINTIAVCGAGTMGSGIAQCAAQHGFFTILFDLNEDVVAKAKANIEKSLDGLVAKEKITADKAQSVKSNIKYTSDLQEVLADVIIEAIIEKAAAKVALFNQLAEINHGEVIFASNTSSLSITEIAQQVLHPHRVVGMHFFNPATIMKLVEVVQTSLASPEAIDIILYLCKELNKTAVLCKDAPGFIVNRVARHFYLESLKQVELGHTSYADMDALLEATGFKMGPFKLMDLIGNDINYAVTESLYNACGQPKRFEPSPIQKEKVTSGKLGKKTGEGYYQYTQNA
jgi:3-hydroxybutyryl-CoA dehydrogenase